MDPDERAVPRADVLKGEKGVEREVCNAVYPEWRITRCRLGSQRRVDYGLGHACKFGSW